MKCKEEVDACRRQVRMNSEVHVVYDDGDTTTETLADDKFTAGAKKVVKPVGRKVDVEDAANASAAIECNQQWMKSMKWIPSSLFVITSIIIVLEWSFRFSFYMALKTKKEKNKLFFSAG